MAGRGGVAVVAVAILGKPPPAHSLVVVGAVVDEGLAQSRTQLGVPVGVQDHGVPDHVHLMGGHLALAGHPGCRQELEGFQQTPLHGPRRDAESVDQIGHKPSCLRSGQPRDGHCGQCDSADGTGMIRQSGQ